MLTNKNERSTKKDKLKEVVEAPEELQEKRAELERLQEKKKSLKSNRKLKQEIEELSERAATVDDPEEEQELINEISQKKATLEVNKRKPEKLEAKISELKDEVAELEKEHYAEVKKVAHEAAKPYFEDLVSMCDQILAIENELANLNEIAKQAKPKNTNRTYFDTIPVKHNPFNITNGSDFSTRVRINTKKLERRGLIDNARR